jgi:chemotaxis protein methyltransferase CheR
MLEQHGSNRFLRGDRDPALAAPSTIGIAQNAIQQLVRSDREIANAAFANITIEQEQVRWGAGLQQHWFSSSWSRFMSNAECTAFLQWALPRLNMRWAGFRKVRGQVCKRLKHRMSDLGLSGFDAYQARLEADPQEWRVLDDCCHITISRFFRDRAIFEALQKRVLPDIAKRAKRERRGAYCWSAGCAAGEEAYTLKILWDIEVARFCPGVSLSIISTDVDEVMLARAREACFEETSLHELPPHLVREAFDTVGCLLCVRPEHRNGIEFLHQDLRSEAPAHLFDLILCRYLAFTYFTVPLQHEVLGRIVERLLPDGYLVVGANEKLPREGPVLRPLHDTPQIFQTQSGALDVG